jgi:hypothetical protein
VNVISWLERASLFTFPKHTHNINGLIGNVHYRQLIPNWGTIGKPGGPMAGSLARQILASEDIRGQTDHPSPQLRRLSRRGLRRAGMAIASRFRYTLGLPTVRRGYHVPVSLCPAW